MTTDKQTLRLTAAQATMLWLASQHVVVDGEETPYFAGVWAIFGHGNVAGIGEALHAARAALPTWRAHNEQGMAHAAVAYARRAPPPRDGLHHLDRPRRDQHGHRRRTGARQPPARTAAARRRVREPAARSVAAGRGARRRHRL